MFSLCQPFSPSGAQPAVRRTDTGGNPILAFSKDSSKVLFDDMLGNTLGSLEGGKFNAINRTAFGESNSDSELNFFTGKPQVEGLGYAFMFRNYRAEQGKWQTADPMGYPDGWNNLAYCNNNVTMYIDWMGANNVESTPENVIVLGGISFSVKAYGYFNESYNDPAISNISASIYGAASGTTTSTCEIAGFNFQVNSTVTISGVSGSAVGSPTIAIAADLTKTITVSVRVGYTITASDGETTRQETFYTTLAISASVKE